ncbi:putative N-acetyltransferase YhbS [Sphingobium sp. OAS761]|uniref:GNAT family N-acetyltransferase n=1 Tax=Sphingobium sp. OAS761 TaxID=2817901 RepID=UPI0020A0C981|nr:GNAT family N-acetyltransferase [Sphingobium sp. OAS761]MCP1470460.1 putative N-acetyltransferase YhbS [Sphingobium sp. OAS761]
MNIRPATLADISALHAVIERAYRGDTARAGWTFESDLLSGPRTDAETLAAIVDSDADLLLVATDKSGAPLGCVQITDRGEGITYLGLLCIDPHLQAAGLGRRLIAEAEHQAILLFSASQMEMTVIDSRSELIAYYERRGYAATGEKRAFPIPLDPPLAMIVLAKSLAGAGDLG